MTITPWPECDECCSELWPEGVRPEQCPSDQPGGSSKGSTDGCAGYTVPLGERTVSKFSTSGNADTPDVPNIIGGEF